MTHRVPVERLFAGEAQEIARYPKKGGGSNIRYKRNIYRTASQEVHHTPYYVATWYSVGSAVKFHKVIPKAARKRGKGQMKNGRALWLPKAFQQQLKIWFVMEGLRK